MTYIYNPLLEFGLQIVASSGVTSINSQTQSAQILTNGIGGTTPTWTSLNGNHRLDIPYAASVGVTLGGISKTDYDSFAAKLVGSSLTTNYIVKWDGTNVVNSLMFDNGTNIGIGTNTPNAYSSLHLASTTLPLKLTSIPTLSLPSASNIGAGGLTWNSTTSSLQVSNGTSWYNVPLTSTSLSSTYIPYFDGTGLADSSIRKITVDPQIRIDDRVTIYGQNASNPALYISTYTTGKGVIVESSNTNVAYEYTGSSTSDTTVYKSVKNSAGGYHMWLQDSTQSGQSPNKQIYDRTILMYTSNNSATTPSSNYGNGLYNLVYSTAGGLNRGGVLRFQYYDIANNKAGYLFGFDASNYSSATSTNITPDGVVIGSNGAPNSYSSLHLESTTKPLKLTSIATVSLPLASNIGVGGLTWNSTTSSLQYSDGTSWNNVITGVSLTSNRVTRWNGSSLVNSVLQDDGTDLSIPNTALLKLNTTLVGSGASLRTLVTINNKRFICSSEEEINYGNLYVGKNAGNLSATTASYITAIGDQSLPLATSDYTTGLGNGAGLNHTTGAWATYLGAFAGKNNTTGARNVYVGFQAGQANNGSDNVIVGTRGVFSSSGFSNAIIIGSQADGTNIATNKLYIDSLANAVPLIGGDFNSKYVAINGAIVAGTTTPNARAILHLQANNKGFLPPVLTTTERDAVSWVAGDAGMIIYNSTLSKHQGWDGTTWNNFY